MKRTLLVSCLASLSAVGCGASPAPEPPVEQQANAIKGGQEDFEDVNVVGMFAMNGGMCTGSLIAPNLVLTARHCVSPIVPDNGGTVQCGVSKFGTPYAGGGFFVSTDQQLSQQGKWFKSAEVRVPTDGDDACGYDVALIILAENVDVPPRVPRIDVPVTAGEPYSAVGYGQQGTSGWSGGERMALGGLTVKCGAGECGHPSIAGSEFLGDTGICQGDSGGPALDAKGKVVGVVSRGGEGCTTPIYGAVTSWSAFITETAKDAAQKAGAAPPFWALSGKSDPEEPPPPPPDAGSAQGQSCGQGQGCPNGYQCYAAGSPDTATCAAVCNASLPCGAGLECSSLGVCTALPAGNGADSNSSGGCSLGGERGPVKPVPWVFATLGLCVGLARRRRARGLK